MADYDPTNPYSPFNDVASMPTSNPIASGIAQTVSAPGAIAQKNPYIPGTEEADWYEGQRQKAMTDWAPGMALNMVGGSGAIPAEANALRTGVGIKAKGLDPGSFRRFQNFEEQGVTPEQNFTMTGWYRGGDGQPRYWISDEGAKLTEAAKRGTRSTPRGEVPNLVYDETMNEGLGGNRFAKLGDVLDHPELYAAYPWLKDIRLRPEPNPALAGSWDEAANTIKAKADEPGEFQRTLQHEMVHAIQSHEGFSPGTNPGKFHPQGYVGLLGELKDRIEAANAKAREIGVEPGDAWNVSNMAPENMDASQRLSYAALAHHGLASEYKNLADAFKESENITKETTQRYMHTHGESEARDVEHILKNPEALKPGMIPLHINPDLHPSRSIEVLPPKAAGGGVQDGDIAWDPAPQAGGGQGGGDIAWDDQPSLSQDLRGAVASGAVHGPANFLGAAGNLRDFLSQTGQNLGLSPETVKGLGKIGATAADVMVPGAGTVLENAPTSQQLVGGVEKLTGALPKAQTTPGKFVEAGTEALTNPGTYLGPGTMLAKGLMGLAGGLGSEAAGEATDEMPGSRLIGGMLAGPLAGRGLNPKVSADAQALMQKGVELTPGQMLGPLASNLEEKAQSLPFAGNLIFGARQRTVEGFNRAAANDALSPIGQRVAPDVSGRALNQEVKSKLGNAYNQLVPNLHWTPTPNFANDMASIHRDASLLPPTKVRQFERIVNDQLAPNRGILATTTFPGPGAGTVLGTGKMVPPPPGFPPSLKWYSWGMQGPEFKAAESKLGKLGAQYRGSGDADQRILGERLGDVLKAMRTDLSRNNPAHAAQLARINAGWAMYDRLRTAGANKTTAGGVFTPGDLLAAAKRGDKSAGKGQFSTGNALMQSLGETAQRVIGNKVPNSGTFDRYALAGLGPLAYEAAKHPVGAIGAGLAGALAAQPYTRYGISGLNYLARPTTGLRGQLSTAGRDFGLVRPLINTPYGDNSNPYAP